jgi:endoglucanase
VLQAWDAVLTATSGKWNVMALDMKNEPYDPATWGAGNPSTDWNKVWTSGVIGEGRGEGQLDCV